MDRQIEREREKKKNERERERERERKGVKKKLNWRGPNGWIS